MNETVLDNKRKPTRGQAKAWSGQLAGGNLGRAAGKFDKLIGALQERYGYDRERAEKELRRRMTKRIVRGAAR